MYRTYPLIAVATFAFAALISGCVKLPTEIVPPAPSNRVCLWVSSDKDAYVATGRTGEEANSNYGLNGSLAVASGPLGRKQSYIHFTPPTLPEGTEILEAQLELYHGARNGDGTTDDIMVSVARVTDPWSPLSITWNNQPFARSLPGVETTLRLRSQSWSGTPDITGIVRDMLATPASNHGFIIWYQDQAGRQVDKGFYSNNDYRRTRQDIGVSPRLLIRAKLPAGKTAQDITLGGFLPPDNDLGRLGGSITMVQLATSEEWPSSWNVTAE